MVVSQGHETKSQLTQFQIGFIIIDEQKIIRSYNEGAEKFFGYDKSQFLGRPIQEFYRSISFAPKSSKEMDLVVTTRNGTLKKVILDHSSFLGPDETQMEVICFVEQGAHEIILHNNEVVDNRDDETGVLNKQGISEVLIKETKRTMRYGDLLSIVAIEINGYAQLESLHGSGCREIVLQTLAIILKNETRDIDYVGRIKDDVFLVILPKASYKASLTVANRISKTAHRYSDDETPFTVTIATQVIQEHLKMSSLAFVETLLSQKHKEVRASRIARIQ